MSYMTSTILKPLRLVFFGICSICFFIQIQECLHKYFNRQTTWGSSIKSSNLISFPTIALCPGFKRYHFDKFFEVNIMPSSLPIYSDSYPDAKEPILHEDVERWWQEMTFDYEDMIEEYNYIILDPFSRGQDIISLSPVSTSLGKCLLVNAKTAIKQNSFIMIKLNMTTVSKVMLYVFPSGMESGLYDNFWTSFPHSQPIERGRGYDIAIEMKIYQHRNSENMKCNDDPTYNYSDCIYSWMQKEYFNDDCNSCRIPQDELIVRGDPNLAQIPFCKTKDNMKCKKKTLRRIFSFQAVSSHTGCMKKCEESQYSVNSIQNLSIDWKNITYLYFIAKNTNIEVVTEYPMYDFNSALAAVGGSLGLFLGFSFWSCFSTILENMEDAAQKMIQKRRG